MKPYYETELGKLYHGDCLEIMPGLEPVDLVLTSPPYDKLRNYNGFSFDYEKTADEINKILLNGAVCVWVVADAVVDGSETGTSFKQALYFKSIGLNIHDTMIYAKTPMPLSHRRYEQAAEYMFVFSKGPPKTFNPIKSKSSCAFKSRLGSTRRHNMDHNKTPLHNIGLVSKYKLIENIWFYDVGFNKTTKDKIAYEHPAIFPERLAADHIESWSNPNEKILDPMCGSGTTCKQAEILGRNWIGIEISEKYCEIAAKRIEQESKQLKLF